MLGHVPSDFAPFNRFQASVRVFAQFSAVFTVPDVLAVDGTTFRRTSPRLTVFVFPQLGLLTKDFPCFGYILYLLPLRQL
jgi:hypothetical protein